MADSTINTVLMNDLVARSRLGDHQARDELIQRIIHRLERLARRMLRQFSNVSRHVEWEEVLAECTMKLLHALETRNPGSTREFFTLAAVIMRNHLIDLARHLKKRLQNEVCLGNPEDSTGDLLQQVAAPESDNKNLDLWTAFHEAVETLPIEEREIFGLIVYHDWSYEEIAELFNCSTKTVQRRYREAVLALRERLGEDMEQLLD